MPVRRPLISRVAGNCKRLFVEFGSVEVVCPPMLMTVGKNGDAACSPNGPTRLAFGNANVPSAGSLTLQPGETLSSARLQASMPNGVTLSLEGCDAQLLAVMIGALGRCDVSPVA